MSSPSKTSNVDPTSLLAAVSSIDPSPRKGIDLNASTDCDSLSCAVPGPRVPPGSIIGGYGLPELSTIWDHHGEDVQIIQSVEFIVVQKRMVNHLRFPTKDRPVKLRNYISDEEWDSLRRKADKVGRKTQWYTFRSLIIVIILFVMVVVINMGDEGVEGFALSNVQICILVFMGVLLAKFVWDECSEDFARRQVLHEMDDLCREYSETLRPRGACLAFRFIDTDDHGLMVDLTFYKVKSPAEAATEIA